MTSSTVTLFTYAPAIRLFIRSRSLRHLLSMRNNNNKIVIIIILLLPNRCIHSIHACDGQTDGRTFRGADLVKQRRTAHLYKPIIYYVDYSGFCICMYVCYHYVVNKDEYIS